MKRGVLLMTVIATSIACSVSFGSMIPRSVIATGGNSTPATNGTRRSVGTVGQPTIGLSQNATRTVCAGFWCFGGSILLGVDPPGGAKLPAQFALGPATPNPTRGEARFHMALSRPAVVKLSVCDVGGRLVGDVVSRPFAAGEHDLLWKAPGGSPGVYFMRLETDGQIQAKRTIVVVR